MSVLTKGLAMDFERQGLTDMAITSLWPAVVCLSFLLFIPYYQSHPRTYPYVSFMIDIATN